MKFLADMGISSRTVNWLKSQGYDAIHLVEKGLEKLEDDHILIFNLFRSNSPPLAARLETFLENPKAHSIPSGT
jgi:hypothetical protein